ncbi:RNA polymerase sigma factor [Dactylosporangium darangshiense]|uniref:Sigma factor-like helix-turn-helix DNA-binding protein n=1 Tax=Dactylosporangium darangshiense TaxID=579108 RepID=A0ABP8DHY2_9ACTN
MTIEAILREEAPAVLASLVRRYGDFDTCEDAVQEALLAAAVQWPGEGVPAYPRGWLLTVASRRWIAQWRSDDARRRRELRTAAEPAPAEPPDLDDSLTLLLLCCHPALTRPSQVALTLRAVGGLSTAEIARAHLVPQASIAQRISRAKQRIREAGARFAPPGPDELPERLDTVLQVLYLVFTEGHTASSGEALYRPPLTDEALRLTRRLHAALASAPSALRGEAAGLLALMLLTEARRPARTGTDGALIPLSGQDRTRWDAALIAEGVDVLTGALRSAPIGPFQVQAAIAAVHAEAPRAEDTDWPQILALYDLLRTLSPGPMVTLNRVVAVAMVHGPQAGLAALAEAEADPALRGHHRVPAVRAHLLADAGRTQEASAEFAAAARLTASEPERRYLLDRAG